MSRKLATTKTQARHVWRFGDRVHVCFPTLARAFEAIARLELQDRAAQYDGQAAGRHWVNFSGGASKKRILPTPTYDGNRFI